MSLLIPLTKQLEGAAKNILKGAALGYLRPKFFNIDLEKAEREGETYKQITQIGYDKIGMLGLPVWDTVTLIAEPYTKDDGTVITQPTGLTLDIALCEISNDRNVVKTKIAGLNGTIKEYMSDGDYSVNIKGSVVNPLSNMPPIDELNALYFYSYIFGSLVLKVVGINNHLLHYQFSCFGVNWIVRQSSV